MGRLAVKGKLFGLLVVLAGPTYGQAARDQARPWLGVAIDKGEGGVLVRQVLPETPAAGAGLLADDIITDVGGTSVRTPEALIKAVQNAGVGTTVKVAFKRSGKSETRDIKLVVRPDELELVRKRLVGQPAPDFNFEVIAGPGPGSAKALRGRVVLLEVWATWCPACRSALPRLAALAKVWRPEDLAIIAVSDEDSSVLKDYVAKSHPVFTVARDGGQVLGKDWAAGAIPMFVVIDRQGTVVFATIGAGTYLDEALAVAEAEAKKKRHH